MRDAPELTVREVNPVIRELVEVMFDGLRARYSTAYEPFAARQDNDDLACFEPARPGAVIVVHDFASEGWERRGAYDSFWDWFRAAVEEMIEADPG